jgi:hypothetical protein
MNFKFAWSRLLPACCVLVTLLVSGCTPEEAADAVKDAGKSAEQAAGEVAEGATEMMEKGKKMAGELGEQAMGFLNPLKEKFGELDGLKDSPEQLKTTVSQLIETIESKADSIQLPGSMNTVLAGLKDKLVALKQYLEGEYDQAQIGEKVNEIMASVKSGLGMSGE